MPLTAEARERMEHTLAASDYRSVTLRREDVRDTLRALDSADESTGMAFNWGYDAAAEKSPTQKSWLWLTANAVLATGALLGAGALGWLGALGKL